MVLVLLVVVKGIINKEVLLLILLGMLEVMKLVKLLVRWELSLTIMKNLKVQMARLCMRKMHMVIKWEMPIIL